MWYNIAATAGADRFADGRMVLAKTHDGGDMATPARVGNWRQDPEGVRRNILDVARNAFVEHGLTGARVDEIAARTATSKRMIYYYFNDKEGLYRAVLEEAYTRLRQAEVSLDLGALAPADALAELVGFSFDYHADDRHFVRLVMVENIHHGQHLKQSGIIGHLNSSAIRTVGEIYRRGVDEGVFRAGLDPLDIHLTISAMAFHNVSNRDSIREVFDHDMADAQVRARRRANVIDTVLRFCLARPD
jgi:AcrR family transcriptional regulator